MKAFPFEVGYASAMTDDEMLALSDELEQSGWKEQEAMIQRMLSTYMEKAWRRDSRNTVPYIVPALASVGYTRADGPYIAPVGDRVYRSISVHVPNSVDPDVARVLAEMQIREQVYGEYDPSYGDD